MQTRIAETLRNTPAGNEADSILRSCVHCGFCTATCPTYQLTGDELDGPRGRIYLIKQLLEHGQADAGTRLHLDRCLSCRSCETTCPSGVKYARLLEIGRHELAARSPRKRHERLLRHLLLKLLPQRRWMTATLALAGYVRPLLPRQLQAKLPAAQSPGVWPAPRHARKVLMLQGCVQAAATPLTNAAAARVLDRLDISALIAAEAGCCGAVSLHLDDEHAAQHAARRNIDAWWPAVEAGAEAIIGTASGCTLMIKEYGQLLQHDAVYASKARKIAALCRDLSEFLASADLRTLARDTHQRLAVHTPCTLQHGQQLPDALTALLARAGYTLTEVADSHLCCGSAGTYSILQPEFATQLRTRKLDALQSGQPDRIVSANIGCQLHLAGGAAIPVSHWIELFDPG